MSLNYNPILAVDSYKFSHAFVYPDNVMAMSSYIEARTKGRHMIVPFGLTMFLKKYLSMEITRAHIDEAEAFAKAHGDPFDRSKWDYIVDAYFGYMPVAIYAVPEGTPVPSGNAIVRIDCTDKEVFWLSSYLETVIQRAVWYPTTIASLDYDIKKEIAHFYRISGADMALLPFALHDFGARGVTCAEQAEIGGAAHMVNFMGSDTVEGIRAVNYYYGSEMAGFSVPATEHSVECSYGLDDEGEKDYLEAVITKLGKPGGIVSIVIDGRDVYRAAATLCSPYFVELIKKVGAKVVFRPDSGDMMEVVPRILEMQAKAYGYTTNSKGYKKINTVGIIQGDGVDHMSIKSLLGKVLALGYTADCVIFGSGGALLQKVNRDTFKFAQKASAIMVDGTWVPISKDPVTDPGKASKAGRQTLVRSLVNGEYASVNLDAPLDVEFVDVMQLVFRNGIVLNTSTIDQIRARTGI